MCDVKAVCHPRGRPPRVESNLVRAAVERARPAIAAVYFGNRGGRKQKRNKKKQDSISQAGFTFQWRRCRSLGHQGYRLGKGRFALVGLRLPHAGTYDRSRNLDTFAQKYWLFSFLVRPCCSRTPDLLFAIGMLNAVRY